MIMYKFLLRNIEHGYQYRECHIWTDRKIDSLFVFTQ